jgi:hypothetical protein
VAATAVDAFQPIPDVPVRAAAAGGAGSAAIVFAQVIEGGVVDFRVLEKLAKIKDGSESILITSYIAQQMRHSRKLAKASVARRTLIANLKSTLIATGVDLGPDSPVLKALYKWSKGETTKTAQISEFALQLLIALKPAAAHGASGPTP